MDCLEGARVLIYGMLNLPPRLDEACILERARWSETGAPIQIATRLQSWTCRARALSWRTEMNEPANIPVFILCGGLGTRIKEETEFRPKPMVPIGEHPILWHVMQIYARHGFRRFVLCLGFKAEVVKDYFSNFHLHNADAPSNCGPTRSPFTNTGTNWTGRSPWPTPGKKT